MALLIDADFLAYKSCAAAEDEADYGGDVIVVTSRFSEVLKVFTNEISRILEQFGESDPILFFSDSRNFRKEIDPSYKGHRNRKKPCGYKRLINWCGDNFEVIKVDGLEADDALGIYATNPIHEEMVNIIASPDKDMRQIPGLLWDMKSVCVEYISERCADEWFLIQAMSGDQTDGYSGIPGYGVKKAAALLGKEGATWDVVLNAYLKAGLTEADALRNARLARILRYSDFDHDTNQPKLWTPQPQSAAASSDGVDAGAAAKDEGAAGSGQESGET